MWNTPDPYLWQRPHQSSLLLLVWGDTSEEFPRNNIKRCIKIKVINIFFTRTSPHKYCHVYFLKLNYLQNTFQVLEVSDIICSHRSFSIISKDGVDLVMNLRLSFRMISQEMNRKSSSSGSCIKTLWVFFDIFILCQIIQNNLVCLAPEKEIIPSSYGRS